MWDKRLVVQNSSMYPDEVIRDPKDDELDRAGFAKALADAILKMDIESPFVFSIEGDWGTGKSTVLEFVKYYLSHRGELGSKVPLEGDPIIVNLSVWWFSGSEDLLCQFLREISLQLRGNKKALEKLGSLPDLLEGLGVALTATSLTPTPDGKMAAFVVKALAAAIRRLTRAGDVASLRRKIERTLRGQSGRIVVFLDDLDRLQPQELLQVFRIVKAVANLPRLVYVLAFDRQAVTKGLRRAKIHDPDQYIEKIVQSVLTVPTPDRIGIAQLAGSIINQIIVDPPSEFWQDDRWNHLYFDGLQELIRTPRDVKRVANALRPSYPPVKSDVNAVDFIGFHALRVLVPKAHLFVVSNRGWLTNSDIRFFRDEDDERKEQNARIDTMLDSLPVWQRGPITRMLETLFPIFDRRTKRSSFSDDSYTRWRQQGRLCSPDRFDFYERFSVPTSAVTAAELSRILKPASTDALRSDLQKLAEARSYDGSTKLQKFLQYATGNVAGTLSIDERQELLNHIFRVADDFISKLQQTSLPFASYDLGFAGLVDAIIGLVSKGENRVASVRAAWDTGSSVSLMVRCFYDWKDLLKSYEAGQPHSVTHFNREEIETLSTTLLERVGGLAQQGSLSKTPLLDFVIHFWDEHDSGAGSNLASQLSASEEGLADLAVGVLFPRSEMATNPVYRSDDALLEKWAATKRYELAQRCEDILALQPEWLQEAHVIALKTFIKEVRNPRDQWGRPIETDTNES